NSQFTLVEFGDYECPSCKAHKKDIDEIMKKVGDKLRFVYHHTQIKPDHKFSSTLAFATYAADQQGKFWEMHDKIYDAQDAMRGKTLAKVLDMVTAMAVTLKLDVLKFRSDMKSDGALKFVQKENDLGSDTVHIQGTPAFFFLGPSLPPKFIPQEQLTKWV